MTTRLVALAVALAACATVASARRRCVTFAGSPDGDWGYGMSTRYCAGERPDGAVNNAIVFAMSRNFFGTPSAPFWALLTARGKGDAADAGELVAKLRTCTDCEAAALFVFYHGLGEYCESGDNPGFQPDEDAIIDVRTHDEATWLPIGGNVHYKNGNEADGVDWFEGWLTEASHTFKLYCRGAAADDSVQGLTVGNHEFKCDVSFNFTLGHAYTTDEAKINGCADEDRYVGFMSYVGSGAIDRASQESDPDDAEQEQLSVDGQKIRYTWKKQLQNQADANVDIVTTVIDISDNSAVPAGIDVAKQVYFSILESKADNPTPIFKWDPSLVADDIAVADAEADAPSGSDTQTAETATTASSGTDQSGSSSDSNDSSDSSGSESSGSESSGSDSSSDGTTGADDMADGSNQQSAVDSVATRFVVAVATLFVAVALAAF